LAHPIRRTILRFVQSRPQGVSYTELVADLGLSTGKLNYHLEQLKGVLEKNSSGYYVLSPFGQKSVEHLKLIEQRTSGEDERYVKIAANSQNVSLQPIVRAFLLLGITAMLFVLGVCGFLVYVALTESAPSPIVYVIPPIGFTFGAIILGVQVYALVKAPLWLKRLERRFFGES
jgi:hypothetical protein